MNPTVIMLALAAAITHASWNAFLRSGADRLWTITVMSLAMTPVAVPTALILPLPFAAAWPYLAVSACIQTGYSLFLVAAYRRGELGQVYPIVRGSVPLLVAIAGFAFTGQSLTSSQIAGVTLIALGIMGLAFGRGHATPSAVLWALATGSLVAAYAMVDGVGVREAGDPIAYAAWISVIYGALLPAIFIAVRGRLHVDLRSRETWKAAGGGLVSLLAYGLVVAAFALGPVAPVAALRETSVVFSVLIGWLFLGERMTAQRLGACIAVAIGAICLG